MISDVLFDALESIKQYQAGGDWTNCPELEECKAKMEAVREMMDSVPPPTPEEVERWKRENPDPKPSPEQLAEALQILRRPNT